HRGANVADSPSSADEIALFCRYRIVNAISSGASYHKQLSGFLLNTSKATSRVAQCHDGLSRKLIASSPKRSTIIPIKSRRLLKNLPVSAAIQYSLEGNALTLRLKPLLVL